MGTQSPLRDGWCESRRGRGMTLYYFIDNSPLITDYQRLMYEWGRGAENRAFGMHSVAVSETLTAACGPLLRWLWVLVNAVGVVVRFVGAAVSVSPTTSVKALPFLTLVPKLFLRFITPSPTLLNEKAGLLWCSPAKYSPTYVSEEPVSWLWPGSGGPG
jgi:hypothetical protein